MQQKECHTHSLAVSNTIVGTGKGYDSNDLVICHPSNPKLMKIYGRADDQLMHSTGEKVKHRKTCLRCIGADYTSKRQTQCLSVGPMNTPVFSYTLT